MLAVGCRERAHAKFVQDLAQYEFSMVKSETVAARCAIEVQQYAALQAEIDATREATAAELQRLKQQLQDEVLHRQHKQQYEAIAAEINQHPSRQELAAYVSIRTTVSRFALVRLGGMNTERRPRD